MLMIKLCSDPAVVSVVIRGSSIIQQNSSADL